MEKHNYTPVELENVIRIDKLYSVHYFSYSKKFRFEGEAHGFWELVYCDSGEAGIIDNAEHYILTEGEAFLHAPDSFHNISPNNKFTNIMIVSFDGELSCMKSCTGKALFLEKTEKALLKTIITEARPAFSDPLNIVYQFNLKPAENIPYGALQIIKNSLESLMLSIYRKQLSNPQKTTGINLPHTQNITLSIIEILNQNIKESLLLKDIAAKLNYSETYIKQIFKDNTGMGIIKYFNNLKIEKAKQLLSETTFTVSQISEQLGFDSVQYFSRIFKKITNMTPTSYLSSITSGVL